MRTLLCLAALTGCSDYGLTEQTRPGPGAEPDIEVVPAEIDFGSVTLGATPVTASVEVRNLGDTPLTVDKLELPGSSFSVEGVGLPMSLSAGEVRPLTVVFAAPHPGVNEAMLTVHSDDPDERRSFVAITGRGRGPWLRIEPPEHDFGTPRIPCPDAVELVLQNIGDAELDVTSLGFGGDDQLVLSLDRQPPYTLAPGEYVEATVSLSPTRPGFVEGVLTAESNDPRGPQLATQVASPVEVGTGSDSWTVPADPPVDLILAVDRSSSMEDDAASLADSFGTFVGTLAEVTNNWRLGVVTLDSGCFNEVLTASTPGYLDVFRTAVTTGLDRDIVDDEALFSLVDRALVNSEPTGCNAGFRRPDTALHIMVVSDEPEQSRDRSAALTWDSFVDRWLTEVRTPGMLKVSGVVDVDMCGEGADGYLQAIDATDGVALSICKGEWGERATELARVVVADVHRFALSQTPVPESLVVQIDGVASDAWSYDAVANEIVFEDVPAGAAVSAAYSLASTCD